MPPALTVDQAISRADVAVVDSTTADNEDMVPLVVAAGIPLFVEKPLADTLKTTRSLAALIDDAGVALSTGMFLRCLPALRSLRTLSPMEHWGSTEHSYTEAGIPPRAGAALAAFLSDLRGQHEWDNQPPQDAIHPRMRSRRATLGNRRHHRHSRR